MVASDKYLNLQTGQLGEKLAAAYLCKKGYKVVERNFRTRFGEIDLIVQKDGCLVFVEVKATQGRGQPEWQITPHKLQQVKKMAQIYLTTQPLRYTDLRIDAVCIILNNNNSVDRIRHYEAMGF
ncbi:YraN family protein [Patescibacteria group bacterium]|nr:YraN family protein [Patescibacteria group bacterium]MBU1931797.1 YraN family protein [Patescibacteria group bacterium]